MTDQPKEISTNASEELFRYAGLEVHFLLTSSDSNGAMSVFEFRVPPNFKIPRRLWTSRHIDLDRQ
jgi:hypothetical protein